MKKRELILIAAASLLIPSLVSAYNYCYQEVEKQQYVTDPLVASRGYYQIWTDMIRVPCDATVTYDFITPAPLAGVYYEKPQSQISITIPLGITLTIITVTGMTTFMVTAGMVTSLFISTKQRPVTVTEIPWPAL